MKNEQFKMFYNFINTNRSFLKKYSLASLKRFLDDLWNEYDSILVEGRWEELRDREMLFFLIEDIEKMIPSLYGYGGRDFGECVYTEHDWRFAPCVL